IKSKQRISAAGNPSGVSSCGTASEHQKGSPTDLIRLSVKARVKRCSGEMRLVIAPDSPGSPLVTPMLKAVARAHELREWVLAHGVPNQKTIAKKAGLNVRYFRRVFDSAFLAPDIVEAILDGRHPPDLTVTKLTS